jgi:hypothetical protein
MPIPVQHIAIFGKLAATCTIGDGDSKNIHHPVGTNQVFLRVAHQEDC